jgi:hypothetical protein
MSHKAMFSGGIFGEFHEELMGVDVDFEAFDPGAFDAALIEEARRVWRERFRTEFRSIQIMTRFMTEVLGAGDPLDVYAGAVDLIEDEVRHAALCAGMCRALGLEPRFPNPVRLEDPEPFVNSPMAERALSTAITMVAISEALSYGFICDLRARCEEPTVSAVLEATVADEEHHQDFGWIYIDKSLARFEPSTLDDWRHLVSTTLEPHLSAAKGALAEVEPERRTLEAWPDDERIELGLFSPQRQALVFQKTYREVVEPKLTRLELI